MTKTTPVRDLIPVEPVEVIRRSASSVEQMRADIAARFVNHSFDMASDTERARRRSHTAVKLGGIQIDHFECVGGRLAGTRPDSFELVFPVKGSLSLARDGAVVCGAPGSCLVSVTGTSCRLTVGALPSATLFSLTLSPELLEAAGVALIGDDFRLEPVRSVEVAKVAGQALSRNVRSVYLELVELDKVGLAGLALPTYKELLGNLTIAALYPERLAARGAEVAPSKLVDRAEDILRARASQSISIREVANELGVTTRTLQMGFRRHRPYTPMQFLLSQRLSLARERLLDPDLRSNVQSVAMSCGFLSMSKFANRYRAVYGETPSVTLERGRRR